MGESRARDAIAQEIGARIRARRRAARLSQAALGAAVGLKFQQIQKYEQGTNRISAAALLAIAKALGVPIGQLIGEADAAPWGDDAALDPQGAASLLEAYGRLSPASRKALMRLAVSMAEEG